MAFNIHSCMMYPILGEIKMQKKSSTNNSRPISVWKETDSIDGEVVKAMVVILKGPGCCWAKKAGCTMCGYNDPSVEIDATTEELIGQVRYALEQYSGEPYFKIYETALDLNPGILETTKQTHSHFFYPVNWEGEIYDS